MFTITEDEKSRKVELFLGDLKNVTVRGKRQAFYKIGSIAKKTLNENILAKPRFGRVYRYRGRKHIASVAGESFANRSGDARKTLGFEVHGSEELEFGFRKNPETIYVKYLEEKLNRPTLKIASKKVSGIAQTIMLDEIKKAHDAGYK